MKRDEIKVKAMFYKMILNFMKSKKDILTLFHELYLVLKDTPVEELKEEFINHLAEVIHAENNKSNP